MQAITNAIRLIRKIFMVFVFHCKESAMKTILASRHSPHESSRWREDGLIHAWLIKVKELPAVFIHQISVLNFIKQLL